MKFNFHPVYRNRYCQEHYFVDPSKEDIWVIGDVHGCADEFETVCETILASTPGAQIIQLGDLIDRGPDFDRVFEIVEQYDVELCIGNHELNFLLEYYGFKKCNSKPRQVSHDRMALLSEERQQQIIDILNKSSNYIRVSFDPGDDTFMPIESWFLSHSPIKQFEQAILPGGQEVTNAWTYCARNQPYNEDELHSEDRYVHGHQHWNYQPMNEQKDLFKQSKTNGFNVDGGCVYGGELVAYNICKNDYIIIESFAKHFSY